MSCITLNCSLFYLSRLLVGTATLPQFDSDVFTDLRSESKNKDLSVKDKDKDMKSKDKDL